MWVQWTFQGYTVPPFCWELVIKTTWLPTPHHSLIVVILFIFLLELYDTDHHQRFYNAQQGTNDIDLLLVRVSINS